MGRFIVTCFFLTSLFLTGNTIYAQQQIFINEFSPELTPQSVELLNVSTQSADISGWFIDDEGGSTYFTVPSGTVLYPDSCLVFDGNFNLNKTSADTIRLFDASAPPTALNAVLVDFYSYKGSPGTNSSYTRYPDGGPNWLADVSSIGLFNNSRQTCVVLPTVTPTLCPTPLPTTEPTVEPTDTVASNPTPPASYENILINEVYPYPLSEEKEWMELFNNNGFEVKLDKWFIDDRENAGSSPKQFSVTVSAYDYATVELSGSIFNNDGDTVRLLDANKTEKDGLEYKHGVKGKSFGRYSIEVGQLCLQDPSPNGQNASCIDITPTQVSTVHSASSQPVLLDYTTQPPARNIPAETISATSISQGSVLGISTPDDRNLYHVNNRNPIKYLSFVSISYSFLTIVSLLIKIRNGFAA